MTRHERFFRAIAGQSCDRPPFSFWSHLPEGAKTGVGAIGAHAAFYRQTGVDFIKMMIDGYRDISQGYRIRTAEDWEHIPLPSMGSAFIRDQLAMIDGVIDATRGEAPVVCHMFSPYSVMRMIWGHELIASHLRDPSDREHLLRGLRAVTAFQMDAAASCLGRTSAAGIMVTVSGAEQDGPGAAVFQDVIRPSDMAVLQVIGQSGKCSMLHLCGWGLRPNDLTYWQDYPADVMDYDVQEDHTLPLGEARQFFTHAKAVMGGFGCREDGALRSGNREQIRALTRSSAAAGGSTGFFVGAGSSFPAGSVDMEMFRLVGETLEEMAENDTGTGHLR